MNVVSTIKGVVLESSKRALQAIVFGQIPYTADEYMPWGCDSVPLLNTNCIFSETANKKIRAVFGYQNANQLANPGENRQYATDADGNEVSRIWQHSDGTIEFGGTGNAGSNTNHAAQYEGLQTAFNKLREDHNALVDKWNAFCSAYVPGSPTVTGLPATLLTSTVTDSTADITPAKLNKILTE